MGLIAVFALNQELVAVRREIKDGMYTVSSYALATSAIQIPMIFIMALTLLVPAVYPVAKWEGSKVRTTARDAPGCLACTRMRSYRLCPSDKSQLPNGRAYFVAMHSFHHNPTLCAAHPARFPALKQDPAPAALLSSHPRPIFLRFNPCLHASAIPPALLLPFHHCIPHATRTSPLSAH
eukprot:6182764-Pleurochrysis_carterae.AAC.2